MAIFSRSIAFGKCSHAGGLEAANLFSSYTIIDEADEMVSDDWQDDMRRILSGGGKETLQINIWVPLLMQNR